MTNYDAIPELTKDALDRYVNHHIPTGGFLYRVLTNDLFGALSKADQDNTRALHLIVKYIYNELPGSCWGNSKAVEEWLNKR